MQRSSLVSANTLIVLIIVSCFLLGVACLLLPSNPFGITEFAAVNFSPDQEISSLEAIFSQRTQSFTIVGALYLFFCLTVVIFFRAFREYIDQVVSSAYKAFKNSFSAAKPRFEKLDLGILVLLILFGAFLRGAFVNQPIRYDEAYSYLRFATKPIYLAISDYRWPNNHLFNTLLIKLSTSIFDDDVLFIRLPVFFSGVILIAATYRFCQSFFNRYSALIACSLIATSSILIEYSTNARGYMILCVLFLENLISAKNAALDKGEFHWLIFVFTLTLGFFTMPIMLYPLLIGLSVLANIYLHRRGQGQSIRYAIISSHLSGLLVLFLYTPVFLNSGISSVTDNRFVRPEKLSAFFIQVLSMSQEVFLEWHRDMPIMVTILIVAGFVYFFVAPLQPRYLDRTTLLRGGGMLCLLLVIQRNLGFARIWLFLLPLYLSLASVGLVGLIDKGLTTLNAEYLKSRIVILLILIIGIWQSTTLLKSQSVYFSPATGTLRSAKEIIMYVRDELNANDTLVYYVPSGPPLEYYATQLGVSFTTNVSEETDDIYVVTNHQSLTDPLAILDACSIEHEPLCQPELVMTYEDSELYRIPENCR